LKLFFTRMFSSRFLENILKNRTRGLLFIYLAKMGAQKWFSIFLWCWTVTDFRKFNQRHFCQKLYQYSPNIVSETNKIVPNFHLKPSPIFSTKPL
jgi:hypothetical protein